MRFKATFKLPTLNLRTWNLEVQTRMSSALERGVIAWLGAATAPIPVWSGASLGTFRPLAQRVNFVLSIAPTRLGSQKGLGAAAGESQSTGRFFGDAKKGQFFAEYSTKLEHLIFNEFADANQGGDPKVFSRLRNPGPYNFQVAGVRAFQQEISGLRIPLPRLTSKKRIQI